MGRKRLRLVPEQGREVFEIRIALYFDTDGSRQVSAVVSDPDEPDLPTLDLVELVGALDRGRHYLLQAYTSEDEA